MRKKLEAHSSQLQLPHRHCIKYILNYIINTKTYLLPTLISEMPATLTRKLGKYGPEIPAIGFGLMGIGIDCYGATG